MSLPLTASDRLIQRARPFKGDALGIGLEHIAKVPMTAELVTDIFECLRSGDPAEVKWGLWFTQGVLDSNPPIQLLRFLIPELPKWLNHDDNAVRVTALPLLIRLRENFPDYRSMMLQRLRDPDPEVRINTLSACRSFLSRSDMPVLLEFQHDNYMSETSMNSPLIYAIRNQALAVIEQLIGRTFPKHENVDSLQNGHTVYWWDWKPFLDWWR